MDISPPADHHPLGRSWGRVDATCSTCAWSRLRGPGPRVSRCVARSDARLAPDWRACDLWEGALDCLSCAGCCGPAYDAVEVAPRDPAVRLHPDLVMLVDGRHQVRRTADNWCRALLPDRRCRIYGDRPRCCRDFAQGGANCLVARRRLGFSRT